MTTRKAAIFLLILLAPSCATNEPSSPTVGGGKDTCEEVVVERVPTGMSMADRTLVPYSSTLMGVETEYESSTSFLAVISGGYLDDHLEPYDDLEPIGERNVLGRRASVVAGSFIDAAVLAAVWEEPGLTVPCGTRAVIAIGMETAQFHEILDALASRQPGSGS